MNTMRDNLEQQMCPTFPFHLKEKVEQSDPVTRYADRCTGRAKNEQIFKFASFHKLTGSNKETQADLTHFGRSDPQRGRHYHRTGSASVQFSRSRGSFGPDESQVGPIQLGIS
jgi:hypothetical protein